MNGQGMDIPRQLISEESIDPLMALHKTLALEVIRNDNHLKMRL